MIPFQFPDPWIFPKRSFQNTSYLGIAVFKEIEWNSLELFGPNLGEHLKVQIIKGFKKNSGKVELGGQCCHNEQNGKCREWWIFGHVGLGSQCQ